MYEYCSHRNLYLLINISSHYQLKTIVKCVCIYFREIHQTKVNLTSPLVYYIIYLNVLIQFYNKGSLINFILCNCFFKINI